MTNNNMDYKGPWTYHRLCWNYVVIVNHSCDMLLTLDVGTVLPEEARGEHMAEQERLAKLIVKAPEMYKMLEELVSDLKYSDEGRGDQVREIEDLLSEINGVLR